MIVTIIIIILTLLLMMNIFNKELDEKLLDLTFVLEYNLEYDKYNNDL